MAGLKALHFQGVESGSKLAFNTERVSVMSTRKASVTTPEGPVARMENFGISSCHPPTLPRTPIRQTLLGELSV